MDMVPDMGGSLRTRVLVDANVLFKRATRDWLGLLSTDETPTPFVVYWTEDILAEAIYQLRKRNPTWDGAKISSIRDRIAETFETGRVSDFTVDSGYQGPDPHDAHVAGAARACDADVLLTFNVKDLAPDTADALPYEVMTPDDLFVVVDDAFPGLVHSCVRRQVAYWGIRRDNPEIVESLQRADCPEFAGRVLTHLQRIALQ